MLRNYEEMQMLLISSNTNDQWPQIDDHEPNLLMASTNLEQMVKAPQTQQQQQQQNPQHQTVQKCPRCDSTNTKFCYYNNYSLSQPRHFCKACKRYWTRGGTLRNVPVGGGCRKNKRVKRPAAATTTTTTTADDHKYLSNPTTLSTKNPNSNAIINVSPLLSNMHSNLSSFQRFSEYNCTRVGSGNTLLHGFDDDTFNPLGFSSGQLLMANDANTNSQTCLNNSCYGSPANNFGPLSTSSGFASLLESDHGAQQKFTSGGNLGSDHNFVEFARHDEDDMQQKVKMEQQMGLVDPNYSMFWSANGVGNYWLDPANIVSRIRVMADQSKFIGRMRGVEIGAIMSAATLKDEELLRAFEC